MAPPALAQRVNQRVVLGGDLRVQFWRGSQGYLPDRNRVGCLRRGLHAEDLPEKGALGWARGLPFREGLFLGDVARFDVPDRLTHAAPAGRSALLELCLAVARAGLDIGHHPPAPGLTLDLG